MHFDEFCHLGEDGFDKLRALKLSKDVPYALSLIVSYCEVAFSQALPNS
jgi:hypothetical protein